MDDLELVDDLEPVDNDLELVSDEAQGPPISTSEIETLKRPKSEVLREILGKYKSSGISGLSPFEKDQMKEALGSLSVSPGKAFATHAANSAVMGFGDEALAANTAAYKKLNGSSEPLSDIYKSDRDSYRDYLKRGASQNPVTSIAGGIAGGIPTAAVIPGGIQSLVAQGALSGVGYSDEDSVGGLARDAAIGAGSAYVADKAISALKSGAKKAFPRVLDKAGAALEAPGNALGKLEEFIGSKDFARNMGDARPELASAARDTTADRLLKKQALSAGLGGKSAAFLEKISELRDIADKPMSMLTNDDMGRVSKAIAQSIWGGAEISDDMVQNVSQAVAEQASMNGELPAREVLKSFMLGHHSPANAAKRVITADKFGRPMSQALGQNPDQRWKNIVSEASKIRGDYESHGINELFSGPYGSIPNSRQSIEPWAVEASKRMQNRAYGKNAINKALPFAGAAVGLATGGLPGMIAGATAKSSIPSAVAMTSTAGRTLREIAARKLEPGKLAHAITSNPSVAQELASQPGKLGSAGRMILESLESGGETLARSRAWILAQQPWFREQLEQDTALQAPQ